jgi:hypothetical protein
MLERVDRKERGSKSAAAIPHLNSLLQAIFFTTHATETRVIEIEHIEAGALLAASPGRLDEIRQSAMKRMQGSSMMWDAPVTLGDHVLFYDVSDMVERLKNTSSRWHLFLSDCGPTGQVRMRDIKAGLIEMLPEVRVFLGARPAICACARAPLVSAVAPHCPWNACLS